MINQIQPPVSAPADGVLSRRIHSTVPRDGRSLVTELNAFAAAPAAPSLSARITDQAPPSTRPTVDVVYPQPNDARWLPRPASD